MTDRPRSSEKLFALLLIFVTVIFSIWLRGKSPAIRIILPYVFVTVGAPLFLGAAYVTSKYHEISDYQPTQFLGRDSNGLKIRAFLGRFSLIGAWLVVLGLILFIIRQNFNVRALDKVEYLFYNQYSICPKTR
jgi:hypothetical protein